MKSRDVTEPADVMTNEACHHTVTVNTFQLWEVRSNWLNNACVTHVSLLGFYFALPTVCCSGCNNPCNRKNGGLRNRYRLLVAYVQGKSDEVQVDKKRILKCTVWQRLQRSRKRNKSYEKREKI